MTHKQFQALLELNLKKEEDRMKKLIKVRKDHQCDGCLKLIPKGRLAIMEKQHAYLSNQLLGQYYYHQHCAL